jgi:hypothetical protein
MQIRFPRTRSFMSPLSEIVVICRASPLPPHHRGSLLGEPLCGPDPARVSAMSSRGWRKKTAGGCRPSLDRTVPIAAYRFGRLHPLTMQARLLAGLDRTLPSATGEVGWTPVNQPRSPPIWPSFIFLGEILYGFFQIC